MKLIPAAERPKRSQSPCPTNRNQHRQTVLLVEFNSTLARHQLTFYHPPLTEANSVAWLVKAA